MTNAEVILVLLSFLGDDNFRVSLPLSKKGNVGGIMAKLCVVLPLSVPCKRVFMEGQGGGTVLVCILRCELTRWTKIKQKSIVGSRG